MPYKGRNNYETVRRIANLSEYLFLKEVRANTELINGKIVFDGVEWTEQEYNLAFPEPQLRYVSELLDGRQIETC